METIKSFSIDFNWVNATWAPQDAFVKADAEAWANWYETLGCNNFWTFAVSYNGCAWYDSAYAPKVKNLQGNFTKDCVEAGHKRGMSVYAYHCLAANPVIEAAHPQWSRKNPGDLFNLIFCDDYIDLFCDMIAESATLCQYDGLVIDWFRCPKERLPQWEEVEQQLYAQRMNTPFPGETAITPALLAEFEKRSIEAAWRRVKDTMTRVNPAIKIWTNQPFKCVDDPIWNGNVLLQEVDFLLNECPDFALLAWLTRESGAHTQIVQNLCGWANHDLTTADSIDTAIYGLFGFAAANPSTCLPYKATDAMGPNWAPGLGKTNADNIAVMRRMFSK